MLNLTRRWLNLGKIILAFGDRDFQRIHFAKKTAGQLKLTAIVFHLLEYS